ncbi:MAG: MFS transporter, partial [Microcoleus sp.]
MVIALLFGAAFLGTILYLTQFNQQVFGANATTSGLMLMPMILGLSITAALSGQLVTKTGKYKAIIMSGFTIATFGVFALTILGPQSPYWHEAVIMVFVGIGLGSGMSIMNLAVQNEFEQKDLGAATASNQLFRGLGTTIGTALLGTILTTGVAAGIGSLNNDAYVQALRRQPAAVAILGTGDVSASTALNLNTSVVQKSINEGIDKGTAKLPTPVRQQVKADFTKKQDAFHEKIVNSFSDSLHSIFIVSGVLMALATIGTIFIVEKPLHGGHDDTPGIV